MLAPWSGCRLVVCRSKTIEQSREQEQQQQRAAAHHRKKSQKNLTSLFNQQKHRHADSRLQAPGGRHVPCRGGREEGKKSLVVRGRRQGATTAAIGRRAPIDDEEEKKQEPCPSVVLRRLPLPTPAKPRRCRYGPSEASTRESFARTRSRTALFDPFFLTHARERESSIASFFLLSLTSTSPPPPPNLSLLFSSSSASRSPSARARSSPPSAPPPRTSPT